ncbi:MAG: thymidine phosphorylase [Clostridiales bacterium]|nr:MAG: thymidine phosphorylase [Clostridiales bacterium]
MNIYEIIKKKRDFCELNFEELNYFVKEFSSGNIKDYQASALLMAMFINDLSDSETSFLTKAMLESGEIVDLSDILGVKADKHSTGGVGDKTTLVVAPLVASCGVKLAKMSGRGLGHTGGTLDKLESIPNFNIYMDAKKFKSTVEEIGLAVIGQTKNIAPADKKLYALRDVTATVDNIGLIASSIMSKKLASGSDVIVLDVKCGSGAFMKDRESAKKLAKAMINIGESMDKSVSAFITDMSTPLGYAIGNSLEVIEAIETLKGNGPEDLTTLSIEIASEIVRLSKKDLSFEEAKKLVISNLENKNALKKLEDMIYNQGGDVRVIENYDIFKKAKIVEDFISDKDGYIGSFDTENIGMAAMFLGAGRLTKEDDIDYSAGIVLNKKLGEKVKKGDVICRLYTDDIDSILKAKDLLKESIHITNDRPILNNIILDKIS